MAGFIDIHSHYKGEKADNENTVVYSHRLGVDMSLPPSPYSSGVHPWDVSKVASPHLIEGLKTSDAIAVGEIGLDYAKEASDKELQADIFRQQLAIAQDRNIPVIIHNVKALEDVMKILSGFTLPAVIFHGFTGSSEQAARINKAGYYISIGERSLYSPKTMKALRSFPVDRLFLETDDDRLPITDIYTQTAIMLALTEEELKTQIHKNFKTLFPTL